LIKKKLKFQLVALMQKTECVKSFKRLQTRKRMFQKLNLHLLISHGTRLLECAKFSAVGILTLAAIDL